ncbi:Pao retrotransposon peptidase family protein-like protein [Aphelenchoides avenae]|nr:Pao retrotransposon peptidase family protein-like protein [Aphelenchus avenae]
MIPCKRWLRLYTMNICAKTNSTLRVAPTTRRTTHQPSLQLTLEAQFCPPGSVEPSVSSGFETRSWPPVSGEPRSTFAEPQNEQLIHHSAAGGRVSSSAPSVGPGADHAVYNGHEAASAFYRTATFHRAAPTSAPAPLVLTELLLKPFDGDIRQYPAFQNQFLDIVESQPDLSSRHKLQYLRGEPYRLDDGLQLTDANYHVVVNAFHERYGNKDMLHNLLLVDFVSLRPSFDAVADLYRFHDEALRVTNGAEATRGRRQCQ